MFMYLRDGIFTKTECDYLYGWIKKTFTYTKISPKVVNPRDLAGGTQKKVRTRDTNKIMFCVQDDSYAVFYGNTNWYLFFRLHYKLCHRLLHFRRMSLEIAQQEESSKTDRKPSTATALRLRTPCKDWGGGWGVSCRVCLGDPVLGCVCVCGERGSFLQGLPW